MGNNKTGNYLVAVVAIVAVVGLVMMFTGGSDSVDVVSGDGDLEYTSGEGDDSALTGAARSTGFRTKSKSSDCVAGKNKCCTCAGNTCVEYDNSCV